VSRAAPAALGLMKGVEYVPTMSARRLVLMTLVVAPLAVIQPACSSSHTSVPKRVLVTPTGQIGPLHVDESDRGDVTSFAGRPDSERHGRYTDYNPPFDALGYGCRGNPATDAVGVPSCETVFYVDSPSGKLALVYTEDPRFADVHGVHAGTPKAVAERRLRRHAFVGCFDGFRFDTRTGFLVMWLQGGRVAFLVVHSRRRNPGVLDCIDS
jgi:hypothetical protein